MEVNLPNEKKETHSRKLFTQEEDELILKTIEKIGHTKWSIIAKFIPGRCSRQIRERWINYLDPTINKGPFTEEEDNLLYKIVKERGTQWNSIVPFFPGRTEVSIKNRWNKIRSKIPELKEIKSNRGRKAKSDKIILNKPNPIKQKKTNFETLDLLFTNSLFEDDKNHIKFEPEIPQIKVNNKKMNNQVNKEQTNKKDKYSTFICDDLVPFVIDQIVYY